MLLFCLRPYRGQFKPESCLRTMASIPPGTIIGNYRIIRELNRKCPAAPRLDVYHAWWLEGALMLRGSTGLTVAAVQVVQAAALLLCMKQMTCAQKPRWP